MLIDHQCSDRDHANQCRPAQTRDEVEAAAKQLEELSDELLVERMVTGAIAELIIGITRATR